MKPLVVDSEQTEFQRDKASNEERLHLQLVPP